MGCQLFQAKLENLHKMLIFIENHMEPLDWPKSLVDKIILASEEALVNIIDYAYPGQKGPVEIICSISEASDAITIVIKDQGIKFDFVKKYQENNYKDPANLLSNDPGGHGLQICGKIMDSVEYQRIGNINSLTLLKNLN